MLVPYAGCPLIYILMHFTGKGIDYTDLRPFVKKEECDNIQITCFNGNMMFYGIQVPVYKCSCIIEFINRAEETRQTAFVSAAKQILT